MLFCFFKLEELLVSQHIKYVTLCFHISYQRRREAGLFGKLGCDVNKWIRGARWQAWNGTSCRRAVRIVQEKVRFHRDYWSAAAGERCSPAGFWGRPTNPYLCSYRWQISSSLCVCVKREPICIRCVECCESKGLDVALTLACQQ